MEAYKFSSSFYGDTGRFAANEPSGSFKINCDMKYFFLCIIASLIYLECTPKVQTLTGGSNVLMSDISSAGKSFKVDTLKIGSDSFVIGSFDSDTSDTSDITIVPGTGYSISSSVEWIATNKIDTTKHKALVSAYDELIVIDVIKIFKYIQYDSAILIEDEIYLMPDFSPIPENYIVWIIK